MTLVCETRAVDGPVRLEDAVRTGGVAWIRGGRGFVGWGEAARFDAGGAGERFAAATDHITDLLSNARVDDDVGVPGTGPVAFASFTFDERSGGSVVLVPEFLLGVGDGRAWLTRCGIERLPPTKPGPAEAARRADRVRYGGSSISEIAWLEAVDRAVREIRSGALEKVVLARDEIVWSKSSFDPRSLVTKLSERFPECYTFLCAGLVGATPELLVRRSGTTVESLVLAGSIARGRDAGEDEGLGRALLGSEKDLGEHRLAVESVARVLGPLTVALKVDEEPHLLRLANVQHLATSVAGELATGLPALDLAGRLHPTAAVCGTPTGAANGLIPALEGMDRGRYAGPVGWMDARGDGEFGIALRCAQLDGARARLFAGAGIVAGSTPEAELEETRLKLRAMYSALGDPTRIFVR